MKATLELGTETEHIHNRTYSGLLKHSCDIHATLTNLKPFCVLQAIHGFEHDTEMLILGKWDEAVELLRRHTDGHRLDTRLLYIRVEWLTQLSTHESKLWLTAHIRLCIWLRSSTDAVPTRIYPRPGLCMTTCILPDLRHYLTQLPLFQTSQLKVNSGKSNCKLTHLLNKCLPKRCQIRELTRFLREYCMEDEVVKLCFKRMIFCSLCGIYRHCKRSPPFNVTVVMGATFLYSSTNGLEKWLSNNKTNNSQTICLHVMREYICVCTATQPTLRKILCTRFNWASFETQTFKIMERIRLTLYTQTMQHSGYQMMDMISMHLNDATFKSDTTLILQSRTRLGLDDLRKCFSRLRANQMKLLETDVRVICKLVIQRSAECTIVGMSARIRDMITNDEACRLIDAVLLHVQCNATEVLLRTTMMELMHIDMFAYVMLEFELIDCIQQQSIRIFTLPKGTRDKQYSGMTQLFETATSRMQSAATHTTAIHLMYCTGCDTIANTVLHTKHVPLSGRSHFMSVRVIVDDDNHVMRCGQSKKLNKSITFESCMASENCATRGLTTLPICGKLIQISDCLYSMCTVCGHILEVGDGMILKCFKCRHLSENIPQPVCSMCHKKNTEHQIILCMVTHSVHMFTPVTICAQCAPTIRKHSTDQIITLKRIRCIQKNLQHRRLLRIPGNQYNFFESKRTTN